MNPPEISQMPDHYFQTTLSDEQRERIENAILAKHGTLRLNLTPAQVEQLTAEHDEVDEMITALEKKSKPPLPPPKQVTPKRSGSTGIATRGVSITYDGV